MTDSLEREFTRFAREQGVARLFADEPPGDLPLPFDEGGQFRPEVAEAAIRRLEADRGYLDHRGIGTEPHADWVFRLGTVAARGGPYQGPVIRSLGKPLRARAQDVELGMRTLGHELAGRRRVDLFPTGDFNAMTAWVTGGALVLVNVGLMGFLFSLLKIHVMSQTVGPAPEDAPLVSGPQVEMLLAESLNAYLYGAGSWMAWPTPPLDERRGSLIAPTLRVCEAFVLAHEYGHLLAGDRDHPAYLTAPPEAPVPGLEIPTASQEAEFAADQRGVEIVTAALEPADGRGSTDETYLFTGIMLFFLLDLVLSHAATTLKPNSQPTIVTTHPEPVDRLNRAAALLHAQQRHEQSFSLLYSIRDWLDNYMPPALARITEVNQTIVRSDKPWWRQNRT
jgi:hypothetical protein